MLEGKELILATKPFAEESKKRSRWEVLSTVVVMVALYGVFWISPLPIQIIVSVFIGLTIVRLFVIYHDFLHKAILHNDRAANVFFTLFGLAILVPPSIWRRSHDYHHKHNSKLFTSSIGSYPVVTLDRFNRASTQEQRIYLFIRHPITILFGYIFTFLYGMCIRSLMANPRLHYDSFISIIFHFSIAFFFYVQGGWIFLVFGWILPNVIASAIGSYLFYAQHNFPDVIFTDKDGWTYVGASLESSSYMKMNPVMQWFTANIGFHHIHHLNARIPFYRLPQVFDSFVELQNPKITSLMPKDIISCLRLKVYDPELKRMITAKEMARVN